MAVAGHPEPAGVACNRDMQPRVGDEPRAVQIECGQAGESAAHPGGLQRGRVHVVMRVPALSNPQDRANIIVYLNQQGSNLPLPAAPAPGAEPATDGGNTVQGGGGGGAAPDAANAVDAVEKDVRGQTGDIANTATPASGAPSVDPAAQKQTGR